MMDTDFGTLTDIGKLFGVSSKACGRWLAKHFGVELSSKAPKGPEMGTK